MSGPTAADIQAVFKRRYQHMLDRTVIHVVPRWLGLAGLLALYALRVYYAQGWYIVTYGLGISLLNQFIGFISPQIDPDAAGSDGPLLPINGSEEFRPFRRRVPEFQFWYKAVWATGVCFVMTFFRMFDIPVFWPILVFYFATLMFMTLRNQIAHMIKYRYVPFTWGKKRYAASKKKGDREGPSGGMGGGGGGPVVGSASSTIMQGGRYPHATVAEPRFTGSNIK